MHLKEYWQTFSYHTIRNTKFYFSAFLIIYSWNTYETRGLKIAVEDNTLEIRDSKKYGFMVTPSYQIVGMQKEKVTEEAYPDAIAAIIERYLVKSRYDLTVRSGKRLFDNVSDFYKNQGGANGLQDFYKVFIATKSKDNKIVEKSLEGKAKLVKYMRKLIIFMSENELPLSEDTIDTDVVSFVAKDNKFSIDVKIKMYIAGVTKGGTAFRNRLTYSRFQLKGYIDVEESHPIKNPLGVKFYDIETEPALNPKDSIYKKVDANQKMLEKNKIK